MIKTYKDLKERNWDQLGIPKCIYRAGNDSLEELHPDVIDLYNKQLEDNPGYELFYFSEDDKLQFIKDLNNFDIERAYDALLPISYKTDLFRYIILSKYGGIYMDFSMETLIPLDDIINGNTQVLARDSISQFGLCTGFIATIKDTDLLINALEKCIYNANNRVIGRDPLDVTGPNMFGDVYKKLNNIEHIELGKLSDTCYMYDFKELNYIYNGEDKIIKIKLPNHQAILYRKEGQDVYYADLWHSKQIYRPNTIKTYSDLKGRIWGSDGIPKWIFRAGNDSLENLHPEIAQIYTTQLENNPDYELFYFSREDKLQFITDQNNDKLLSAYNTIVPEAFKTDIFRYVIINTYGGVYMDFSMQTLVPLADIIKNYTYVYVKDSAGDYDFIQGIYNAFIISPKDNTLLKTAIERCVYNISNRIYGETDLSVTSPHLLGTVYREINDAADVPVGPVGEDTIFYNHPVSN
jgi:mannosyltransferase OCH1-like enzyme